MKINKYHETKKYLKKNKYVWLVTGVAGFIGSNLLEELLSLNQKVIGIDDFSNGSIKNLNEVSRSVLNKLWINFKFIKGDSSEIKICKKAINKNVDFVLHQAARGSVLKSILDPIKTNNSNVTGFLNILYLSKEYKIKSFVYASSSAVYGDSKFLPKK
jgi:UDP-N-acetylglucosamine 4-epimerase